MTYAYAITHAAVGLLGTVDVEDLSVVLRALEYVAPLALLLFAFPAREHLGLKVAIVVGIATALLTLTGAPILLVRVLALAVPAALAVHVLDLTKR